MTGVEHYLSIFTKAVFIENIVLAYFLGLCSFLAISKKIDASVGIGLAVIVVLTITAPINWFLWEFLLDKGALVWISQDFKDTDLGFLKLIVFISVIAAMVQLVEMFMERFSQSLYNSLGIFLPLIAVNCSILGGSLFMVEREYTISETVVYGFGSGVGFFLAIVALASIRYRIRYSNIPPRLRGVGMAMLLTGLLSMAFMAFSGDRFIMSDILLGVIVFSSVILLLVIILNVLGDILLPQGEVTLLINDDVDKSINVQTGGTVLSALAAQNVYLPSACGGQGTCAQCKCQVTEGGGDILPTEEAYISRSDQKDNWRLGCQVKIRNDMKIKVPDEIFSIRKWDAVVKSNDNVATFIKELILELPEDDPIQFESGGYIQIDVPEYKGLEYKDFEIQDLYTSDWDKFDIWQYVAENKEPVFRAYSMANHPAEGNMIMLNIRIASPPPDNPSAPPGIASSYVFDLKEGDKVTVSGPYGEFFIKDTDREMVYIGGGAGMAPLRSHIFHLLKTEKSKRKISFWYGARSEKEMFYDDEFKALAEEFDNFSYHVALSDPLPEDNWEGPTGFIHQVAHDMLLRDHEDPTECEYYLCGPPMMISAVQKMLWDLGVEEDMIAYDDFG